MKFPIRRCLERVRRCLCWDDGVTAVEYSVMLALILLLCVAAIETLGCNVRVSLENSAQSIAS